MNIDNRTNVLDNSRNNNTNQLLDQNKGNNNNVNTNFAYSRNVGGINQNVIVPLNHQQFNNQEMNNTAKLVGTSFTWLMQRSNYLEETNLQLNNSNVQLKETIKRLEMYVGELEKDNDEIKEGFKRLEMYVRELEEDNEEIKKVNVEFVKRDNKLKLEFEELSKKLEEEKSENLKNVQTVKFFKNEYMLLQENNQEKIKNLKVQHENEIKKIKETQKRKIEELEVQYEEKLKNTKIKIQGQFKENLLKFIEEKVENNDVIVDKFNNIEEDK